MSASERPTSTYPNTRSYKSLRARAYERYRRLTGEFWTPGACAAWYDAFDGAFAMGYRFGHLDGRDAQKGEGR